MEQDESEVYEG